MSHVHTLFKPIEVDKVHSVNIPGKLFIAGEYAILFPKQPAIIIAVDRYLTASIKASEHLDSGVITTELTDLAPLTYSRQDGFFTADEPVNPQWTYVLNAIKVTEELIHSLDITTKIFDIDFKSQLVNDDGLKFGLGSSGAVVVATIQSILNFYGLETISKVTLFKLAAIALTYSNSNGSLADIATITHGGWVYYQSFDRQWLKQRISKGDDLDSLLVDEWPGLIIESLTPPEDLSLLIGWTGQPASTDNLVAQLLDQIEGNKEPLDAFLSQSATSVNRMRDGFLNQSLEMIKTEVNVYRQLLLLLGHIYHLNIETSPLNQLVGVAGANHYGGKSSGAGGGDCGIAIGSNNHSTIQLIQDWKKVGIRALPLKVSPTYE